MDAQAQRRPSPDAAPEARNPVAVSALAITLPTDFDIFVLSRAADLTPARKR